MKVMSHPEEVVNMEESHNCSGCESLIIEVEFKSGEKEDIGCKCEVGGES